MTARTERATALARLVAGLDAGARKQALDKLEAGGVDYGALPIVACEGGSHMAPASYAQRRLWLSWQLEPRSSAYNVFNAVTLRGELSRRALDRAVAALVRRHASLRTTFRATEGGDLEQIIVDSVPGHVLDFEDLTAVAGAERRRTLDQRLQQVARAPFDLENGPLFRARVLAIQPDEHVVLIAMHHAIADGWSMRVFLGDLVELYVSEQSGLPARLPALTVQYADYARWQRAWMDSAASRRQADFWLARLGTGRDGFELRDRPRPDTLSNRAADHCVRVGADLAGRLRAIARRENGTLAALLLASFSVLLHRRAGSADVRVGVTVANRARPEVERLIGVFVNTLVMRVRVSAAQPFSDLVRAVGRDLAEAQANQDLPFDHIVDVLQPPRSANRHPLFQVSFDHQWQAPIGSQGMAGLRVEPLEAEAATTQFDLSLHTLESAGGVSGRFSYMEELFQRSYVERLAADWVALLDQVASAPARTVSRLLAPARAASDLAAPALALAASSSAEPVAPLVHEAVARQAARQPDAVAVEAVGQCLTYASLQREAERLAAALQRLGVGPDVMVALCLERSPALVIGMLGVVLAGGIYLALDPGAPPLHLQRVLDDSGAHVIVMGEARVEGIAGDRPVIELRPGSAPRSVASIAPASVMADSAAYCIYTSGSTGRPKGVVITHGGLANHMAWMQREFRIADAERVLYRTSPTFDASVWEVWLPLMSGARLVIASPASTRDPVALVADIRRHDVTVLQMVPQLLRELLETDRASGAVSALAHLFCGGEELPVETVRRLLPVRPEGVCNLYGPTECTIDATWWLCQSAESNERVPIGRAISGLSAHVLDSELKPVAIGAVGELFVSGRGLARGYRGAPQLTAERFLPDPSDGATGERIYRTGDLARRRADGAIECLGRIDRQVKIRGFRVELDEVAARLREHPKVVAAAAAVHEDERQGQHLVGYVVPDIGEARDERIDEIETAFEDLYARAAPGSGPQLGGWIGQGRSELSGPEQQSRFEHSLRRIRALMPRRVLDVGCGAGLFIERLATECSAYEATDFSARAVAHVRSWLNDRRGYEHVRVRHRQATDYSGFPPNEFDTVILNGVVPYFPDREYLREALTGAVSVLRPGGSLFIGDVRMLPLQRAYQASVQMSRAPDGWSLQRVQQSIDAAALEDDELALDPEFFVAWASSLARRTVVRALPKRGTGSAALERYAYDVVVRVESDTEKAPARTIDWPACGASIADVESMLVNERPAAVLIRGLPNRRLSVDLALLEALSRPAAGCTVRELRDELAKLPPVGDDPEALWQLGERLGYSTDVRWTWRDAEGRIDVLFARSDAPASRTGEPPNADTGPFRPWSDLASQPSSSRRSGALGSEVRAHLQASLPAYMVPDSVVVLKSLPLLANGKVDHAALPRPQQRAPARVAPANAIEATVATIWEDILGVRCVGATDNFFELGGNSLLAIKLVREVSRLCGKTIPLSLAFRAQTVRELVDAAVGLRPSKPSPLTVLQPGASPAPPLFCVHGWDGHVADHWLLARSLAGSRAVFGVSSSEFTGDADGATTIEELAARYAELIAQASPDGRVYLLGHSLGGALAVEIARALRGQGIETPFLGIVDDDWPSEPSVLTTPGAAAAPASDERAPGAAHTAASEARVRLRSLLSSYRRPPLPDSVRSWWSAETHRRAAHAAGQRSRETSTLGTSRILDVARDRIMAEPRLHAEVAAALADCESADGARQPART